MTLRDTYTCLQLTNTTVRRVDIRDKAGRLSQVRSECAPLPETGHKNALVETVLNLLSGIRSRTVFVSISSNEVLLKRIDLPAAVPQVSDAEKQNAAILTALEHENHIPVSLNAVAYDFHLMTETALLVGWMRRVYLNTLNKYLDESGIKLAYLTPQPVVLANQLLSEWGDERVCGIHIDGRSCDLVVIEGGEVCLGRSFAIGTPDQLLTTVRQTLANCPALERMVLFQGAPPP